MRSSDVYCLLRFFFRLLPAVLNFNLLRTWRVFPLHSPGKGMDSLAPAVFNAIIFVYRYFVDKGQAEL
jgi:hypothetical protein